MSLSSFSQDKEEVYAGIILHIMKYVEWPEDSETTMDVGIVNNSELTDALNKCAEGKKIHFKDVSVVKFSDLDAITDCHVLFVPKKSTPDVDDVVSFAEDNNVLVITEEKSESVTGAGINFFEEAGTLKFEIYSSQVDDCGLKISEQLTKYAIVKD